jgi:two-component system chemotaxis response regulator CheB
MRRNLIAIGASAGGIDAISAILNALPADFPASICVVVHLSPDSPGVLDVVLRRASALPVVAVTHREMLRPGTVYVPVPNQHLIVEPSLVRASHGPKENRFRPAIDPLFRSAAQTFGPRAVGVVLTGGLDDGTAGLWAIKQCGGVAVVQDPADALVPSMPRSAQTYVAVDNSVPHAENPTLLLQLAHEDQQRAGGYTAPQSLDVEVNIAKQDAALMAGIQQLGAPSIYSCPECHGVLLRLEEGGRVRFRCHTGHAYSPDSLLADMDAAIEESLWDSVRALQEKVILVRHLEEHARNRGDAQRAELLAQAAAEASSRAERVREVALAKPQQLPQSGSPLALPERNGRKVK